MSYIAKKQNQEVVENGYYELFIQETVKDINDKEVIIPRSIGNFSIGQLNAEKSNLQNQIAEIDNKISAIEALQ